eukprot:TRINITY_DN1167_c0_g1_i3.p1 TRINITY_DN1167_c0_g1~~TRINITY_DN1167_c0_g1_i3.p1  ORF type:complete len:244 (+),score=35.43 TRINITY_DN1167_c0_g1_i3:560-1291(+)
MGFYLLHEAMLESVLFARDKFLKSSGKMFPSSARILACPVSMTNHIENHLTFWNNVYGYDFSSLVSIAERNLISKPCIVFVSETQLLSTPQVIFEFECQTVLADQIQHIESKNLKFESDSSETSHGACLWFEVIFSGTDKTVVLSTGPGAPKTHWKQTVIFFPKYLSFGMDRVLEFCLDIRRASGSREYDITLELKDIEDEVIGANEVPEVDSVKIRLLKALGLDPEISAQVFTNGDEELDMD